MSVDFEMSSDINEENYSKNGIASHQTVNHMEQAVHESKTKQKSLSQYSKSVLKKMKKKTFNQSSSIKSTIKFTSNSTRKNSNEKEHTDQSIETLPTASTFRDNRLINGFVQEQQTDIEPIIDYAEEPLLSLIESCQPLVDLVQDIVAYAQLAIDETALEPPDNLSVDESAAIRLYTMEWDGPRRSLYSMLNHTLKKGDRNQLRPYYKYMKLFLTALVKLPCQPLQTVWRGVTKDVSDQFLPGTSMTWWAFSSCTTSLSVLENQMYLGTTGARTLFSVESINARSIRSHSHFVTEDEVLLLPGTFMIVLSQFSPAPDLHVIHLKQIKPEKVLLELPFENAYLYPLEPEKIPWYKKKRTIVELVLIILLCIAGLILGIIFGTRKPLPKPICVPHGTGVRADLMWSFDCADTREDLQKVLNGTAVNGNNFIKPDFSGQGKALALNSRQNQYIRLPYSLNLTLNTSFSICIWLFRTGSSNQSLISDCNNFTKTCLVMKMRSKRISIELISAQSGNVIDRQSISVQSHLCQSCWTYLSFVYNNSQQLFTVYMNGIVVDQRSMNLNVVLEEVSLKGSVKATYIGVNSINMQEFYNGLVDQLSIAYFVKNASEILNEASLLCSYTFDDENINQDTGPNHISAISQHVYRMVSNYSSSLIINETNAYFQFSGMILLKSNFYENSIVFRLRPTYGGSYESNTAMAIMQISFVVEGIFSPIYVCILNFYINLDTRQLILYFSQIYTSITVDGYILEEDAWTHVGLSFANPDQVTIYINGQKWNNSFSIPFSTMISCSPRLSITLGGMSGNETTLNTASLNNSMICFAEMDNLNYVQMKGAIDDVLVFARALDSSEFATLSANRGSSLKNSH